MKTLNTLNKPALIFGLPIIHLAVRISFSTLVGTLSSVFTSLGGPLFFLTLFCGFIIFQILAMKLEEGSIEALFGKSIRLLKFLPDEVSKKSIYSTHEDFPYIGIDQNKVLLTNDKVIYFYFLTEKSINLLTNQERKEHLSLIHEIIKESSHSQILLTKFNRVLRSVVCLDSEDKKLTPLNQKETEDLCKLYMNDFTNIIYESESQVKLDDEKTFYVSTIRKLPLEIDPFILNDLINFESDFIFSTKIEIPNQQKLKAYLETRGKIIASFAMKSDGRSDPEKLIQIKDQEELLKRISEGERGVYVRVGLISTKPPSNELFKEEKVASLPVFLSHLPGSLGFKTRYFYPERKFLTSSIIASSLIALAPYKNRDELKHLSFETEQGEKFDFNIFNSKNISHNGIIVGTTGSGKSFLSNLLIRNAKQDVIAVELGSSFKNNLLNMGAEYLNLNESSTLNPFDFKTDVIVLFLESILKETLSAELRGKIYDLIEKNKPKNLSDFSEICKNNGLSNLSQSLIPYQKPNSLTFDGNTSVNLESPKLGINLSELSENYKEAYFLLLFSFLRKRLFSEREKEKVLIIDEAWQFLSNNASDFISEIFRTTRKYKASIFIVTQSILDLHNSPKGKTILNNAATRILLKHEISDDLKEAAKATGLNDAVTNVLLNLKTIKNEHSESLIIQSDYIAKVRIKADNNLIELFNTDPWTIHQNKLTSEAKCDLI